MNDFAILQLILFPLSLLGTLHFFLVQSSWRVTLRTRATAISAMIPLVILGGIFYGLVSWVREPLHALITSDLFGAMPIAIMAFVLGWLRPIFYISILVFVVSYVVPDMAILSWFGIPAVLAFSLRTVHYYMQRHSKQNALRSSAFPLSLSQFPRRADSTTAQLPLVLQSLLLATSLEEKRSILERNQEYLLTDKATEMLRAMAIQAYVTGNQADTSLIVQNAFLINSARLSGIEFALSFFEAVVSQSGVDGVRIPTEDLIREWMSISDYRQQREFLETHPELIQPPTIRILTELITNYEEDPEVQQIFRLGREVIRYILAHDGSSSYISDAYVNTCGGLSLPFPDWLQEVITLDQQLQKQGRPDQTAEERVVLWQDAFERAQSEQVAKVILAEISALLSTRLDNIRSVDRLQIIDKRIELLIFTLQIYTSDRYPYQWMMRTNNLGGAYMTQISGSKSDNLERAIACFESSRTATIYTATHFPVMWGSIHHNLGEAYRRRIEGIHAENLEKAIGFLNTALQFRTITSYPELWARSQNILGGIYTERIMGNQSDNIEQAIACLEAALTVYTRDAFSEEWAGACLNLGEAYRKRRRGGMAENIERAIKCFEAALSVFHLDTFPEQWAMTTNNLGLAFRERIDGYRSFNMEIAISLLDHTLDVYERDTFPEQWAMVHVNLGILYYMVQEGDRAEHLERSLDELTTALTVYTSNGFPLLWARAQFGLGNTYFDRIEGIREENVERALSCYEAALEVFTKDAFPYECQQVNMFMANALVHKSNWQSVQLRLREALEIEDLRFAEASDLHGQEAILNEGRDVSLQLAFVNALLEDLPAALVVVESGRARNLAQARQLTFADPSRIQYFDRRSRYESARDALKIAQAELRQSIGGTHYLEYLAVYIKRKQDFDAIIIEIETAQDPSDFLHQSVTIDDIVRASPNNPVGHALIYLIPTTWGGVALGTVTTVVGGERSSRILSHPLPQLTTEAVFKLIEVQNAAQHAIGGYIHAQEGNTLILLTPLHGKTLREKAETIQGTADLKNPSLLATAVQKVLTMPEYQNDGDIPFDSMDAERREHLINAIDHNFLQLELQQAQESLAEMVLRPVAAWLQKEEVTNVTLIPCGYLAAFPLVSVPIHAANGEIETFGDRFVASVSPSALALLHGDPSNSHRMGVATLGNPKPSNQSLEWGEAEAIVLALLGGEKTRGRIQYQATRDWFIEQVQTAQVFDASCHGFAKGSDFLDYHLILANGELVTLRDALDGVVNLYGLRLLILSACQTGIINLRGATSEMRSLAVGFLQAGASAVMGALWSVDDLATYLLMIWFAQEWFPVMDREPPAAALARAQRWLRSITWADLLTWNGQHVLPAIEAATDVESKIITQIEQVVTAAQHEKAIRRADTPNAHDAIDFDTRGFRMDGAMADEIIAKRAKRRSTMRPDERPFADPYYWAAFQITGW